MKFEFEADLDNGQAVTVRVEMSPPEPSVGVFWWYGYLAAFDTNGVEVKLSSVEEERFEQEASRRAAEREEQDADWEP